jgi:uncharacterized protein GlcG (DUF336 family)
MRMVAISLVSIGFCFGPTLPPAAAQVNTDKNISLNLALQIAQAAMDSCAKQGFHNSLHVVDRTGRVILAMRGDDANPHTFDNSFRKAYTAKTLRVATSVFVKRLADPATAANSAAQATLPNMVALAGGVPIKVGNDVIGAVALSGSPGGDKDEACAQVGVAAAADQLK